LGEEVGGERGNQLPGGGKATFKQNQEQREPDLLKKKWIQKQEPETGKSYWT